MTRSARWVIPAATVAVIALLGVVHAEWIGHYAFTALPRFGWLCVYAVLAVFCTYAAGLPEEVRALPDGTLRACAALVVAAGFVSVLALLVGEPLLPRFVVLGSIGVSSPLLGSASLLAQRASKRRAGTERVLAVCNEEEGRALAADLERAPERPAVLAARLEPEMLRRSAARPAPVREAVESAAATLIVLNRQAQADEDLVGQVVALHRGGVRVRTLSLFYDQWLGKLPVSELEQMSLLFDINEVHRPAYQRTKRVIDVAVAIPGLIACALVIPLVLLANLAGNRGPLLFRQTRVGKNNEEFVILKFRTMHACGSGSSWTSADDARLGPVGRLLRRSHVDELPQFLNVLRSELSVVGPRPEQPHYVAELMEKIPYYEVRHLVRPGITGWAQVKYHYGSSELDAYEKLQYEFYYLAHQSPGLDLRVIGRTLRSVAGRRGR
jgi:lipopolysaccharide/colanic/teichoic acid biosynthesis glycosyltransferase